MEDTASVLDNPVNVKDRIIGNPTRAIAGIHR
jgi:hypothetical protein